MNSNHVEDYGWTTDEYAHSCSYVTPVVLEVLKRLRVRRVLDLGSGNGALCEQLHSSGFETVGVEYDRTGVEFARSKCPQVPFYNFSVENDPAAILACEQEFDAAVSTEAIEHLYAPHKLVEYAASVLRDSGYLIITTPYHGYVKNVALSVLNKWDSHHSPLWHGGHIKFWSRDTLTRLLIEHGFIVEGFSGVGRLPYLWKSMVLIARKCQSLRRFA